jgi:hypothetical protein
MYFLKNSTTLTHALCSSSHKILGIKEYGSKYTYKQGSAKYFAPEGANSEIFLNWGGGGVNSTDLVENI